MKHSVLGGKVGSLRVLHIAETLPGGPASYLNEILPFQVELFGKENVGILIPDNQKNYINDFNGRFFSYRSSGRNFISLIRLERAIARVLKEGWDIVHLHSSFAGAIARLSPFFRKSVRTKFIYCAHCWAFDRPSIGAKERLFIALERLLSKNSDALINISPHEMDLLKKYSFDLGKTHLVVSGISDVSTPDLIRRKKNEVVRLLFVGRLDEQKGVDLLISVLKEIKLPYEIVVIGSAVVGKTDHYEFPNRCNLLGWVPRNEIPEMMRSSDFLLMPSRWEGMPLVALEALCCGLPIIANDIPSLRSLAGLVDEVDKPVVLIDYANGKSLDLALSKLLANDSLESLSRSARLAYEKVFSSNKMNHEILSVYEKVLENR